MVPAAARVGAEADSDRPVLTDWREAFGNRAFLGFSVAMIASYALSFQVYLGLPLEVRRLTGGESGVVALFVISALLGMTGQVRLTTWCKKRWGPGRAMSHGLAVMGLSFLILIIGQAFGEALPGLISILLCATALTIGTMMVFPFEMATIAGLARGRLIGTYYGLYNLLSGLGILLGNLMSGAALDLSRATGVAALPWLVLAGGGLDRRGSLDEPDAAVEPRPNVGAAR